MNRALVAAILIALYILHFDFWFWHRPQVLLGLPVGLLYHVGYCVVVAITLAALTRRFGVSLPPGSQSDRPYR